MKKLFALTLIAMSIVLTLLAISAFARRTDPPGDTLLFKSLLDRYWAAWRTLKVENAAPFYAQEANLVVFDVAPLRYRGWEAYKTGVKKDFLDKTARLTVANGDDFRVTRHDTIAWTTGTYHLTITSKEGASTEMDVRHTAIWEKRGNKWLIVHEHTSLPAPE